jgi:hypothetical protein
LRFSDLDTRMALFTSLTGIRQVSQKYRNRKT